MKINAQKDRLYKDVEFLTLIEPPRNVFNIKSLEKAASYIVDEFSKLNCNVEDQWLTIEKRKYRNIIASFGTANEERLIVGAHYDVCGNQPGADDNASAVAGLLETARILSELKPELPYRVDCVAYALEEPPYFCAGSDVHASYLSNNKIPVRGMICYEMIGYFSDAPDSQSFPYKELKKLYPSRGNFIVVAGKQGQEAFSRSVWERMKENAVIDVHIIDFLPGNGPESLSDNSSYWEYGYPAVMITDTANYRNPNYHLPTDTIETLDFDRMTEVINGSVAAIINLNT